MTLISVISLEIFLEDALCEGLIKNELIDGASDCINDEMDKMMDLVYMD